MNLSEFCAVGGYIVGDVEFDPLFGDIFHGSPGNEDAFAALRHLSPNLDLPTATPGVLPLHLKSEQDERITGIDVSEHSARIAVTGFFEDGLLDFNPNGGTVTAGSHAGVGNADLFVAVYNFDGTRYQLHWLHTINNPGNDSGTSVAFDSMDNVYVTGWLEDNSQGGNGRDIWVARFNDPQQSVGLISPVWSFIIGDEGDDAGLDITVDHLDRPVVSGQFGNPYEESIPTYCLDFDPLATSPLLCSQGALDGFVARYFPNGTLDWAFQVGASYDERVSGVDVNRRYGGRLGYGGAFGEPSALMGYQVDFNPDVPGTNFLATQGAGDGFACASDPILPGTTRAEVAIVLDLNSVQAEADWKSLVAAASNQLKIPNLIPWDGKTVVTVLATGSNDHGPGTTTGPLIPWTAFDAETAPLFAQRLANTSQPHAAQGGTQFQNMLGKGIMFAAEQTEDNGAFIGYRSVLLVTSRENFGDGVTSGHQLLQNARDIALDEPMMHADPLVDQINMLVVHTLDPNIDRQYALDNAVESVLVVPNLTAQHPNEDNLGFAAYLNPMQLGYQDPKLSLVLGRMFSRMGYCPGDYNRANGLDPNDPSDFTNGSVNQILYADWNFDGQWDGHVPTEIDFEQFNVSFNVVPLVFPCP